MTKSQLYRVRSQHPLTQWNKVLKKTPKKSLYWKIILKPNAWFSWSTCPTIKISKVHCMALIQEKWPGYGLTQRVLNEYRGPGFLAVIWLGSSVINGSTNPLPPSSVSNLYRRHTGRLRKRDKLPNTETYNQKKALPSMNHLILSGLPDWQRCFMNASKKWLTYFSFLPSFLTLER